MDKEEGRLKNKLRDSDDFEQVLVRLNECKDGWQSIESQDIKKVYELYQEYNGENKNFMFYIALLKIQEVLLNQKEWAVGIEIYNTFLKNRMQKIINSSNNTIYDIDIIETIIQAMFHIKGDIEFDDILYKALKEIFSSNMDDVYSFVYRIVSVYIEGVGEIKFDIEWIEILNSMISTLVKVSKNETHKDTIELLFETLNFQDTLATYIELEKKYVEFNFKQLKEVADLLSMETLYDILEYYQIRSLYFTNIKKEECGEEYKEEYKINRERVFVQLFNCIKFEEYKEIGKERFLNIINSFLNDEFIEEKREENLLKLSELINQKGLPKFKKESIENLIYKTWNIEEFFSNKQYKEVVKIYEFNKGKQEIESCYFEIAYSLSECNSDREAKNIYEKLLLKEPTASIHNNLGVIYENEGDFEKAKEYYTEALKIDKEEEIYNRNFDRIQDKINAKKERIKKLKDVYFKKTEGYEKSILFSIYKLAISEPKVTINTLCIALNKAERYIKKIVEKLGRLELLYEKNGGLYIEPIINELVGDYIDPKVERQIVKVDNSKLYRPIFYHESELVMYRVLKELFPQQFVFPNLSLKTIFEIEKMKDIISKEQLEYLYKAHVDFAIINTTTYFPILAFEKDSGYNDDEYSKALLERKNEIFRIGGIPLVRIRFNSAIDYEKLKYEIKEATKALILEQKSEDTINSIDFSKELDVKRFGITNSPIDIEIVKREWEKIVGEAIAQKTHVVDIEEGVLKVEVAKEIESIILLGQAGIKEKIIEQINVIKDIEYTTY